MKIVVLDGYTANPGDLDWSPLAALGELTVHDRTPAALTVARAAGARVVLTNKVLLGEAEMAALPELRYIGVLATGYNVVDVSAARRARHRGDQRPGLQHAVGGPARLCPAAGTDPRRWPTMPRLVRAGDWSRSPDFAFWDTPQVELAGLTFGIVGFGAIGQAVARIALAFGMRVLVHTRTPDPAAWPEVAFCRARRTLCRSRRGQPALPADRGDPGLVDAARLAGDEADGLPDQHRARPAGR